MYNDTNRLQVFHGYSLVDITATGVTAGTYGGAGATPAVNHLVPVITVDAQGRLTSAANVTITNTAVYANSGQLTANTNTNIVYYVLETS